MPFDAEADDRGHLRGVARQAAVEQRTRSIQTEIARQLRLTDVRVFRAAYGIFTIVNNNMVNGIRRVSVERGYDPRDFALFAFGEKQRGVPPVVGGVLKIGDAFLPANRLLVVGISLALIIGLLLFVQYTKPGRAMRAVAQDREVTQLMGVDVAWISAMGFGIGAALAGLAGGLLVTVAGVNAGIGTAISTKAFIMIMIGGAGVVAGAILGAVALGFIEAIGTALFPGSLTYLLIFVALIVFLIFRPQGIMGKPWG